MDWISTNEKHPPINQPVVVLITDLIGDEFEFVDVHAFTLEPMVAWLHIDGQYYTCASRTVVGIALEYDARNNVFMAPHHVAFESVLYWMPLNIEPALDHFKNKYRD